MIREKSSQFVARGKAGLDERKAARAFFETSREKYKRGEIAAALTALMSYKELNRTELAGRLNWTKSRVTRVLSGQANLTFKTVIEFSSALGFDFDVVFRPVGSMRSRQPWSRTSSQVGAPISVASPSASGYLLITKTREEVEQDIKAGNANATYVVAIQKLEGRGSFAAAATPSSFEAALITNQVGRDVPMLPANVRTADYSFLER